jgi:cysteine desulfuration protein SufE
MSTIDLLPEKLKEIVEDFRLAQGREKVEMLLDYSDSLPSLPERLQSGRDQMDQVEECMTPVFLLAEKVDGRMHFHFDIPPESPTVRGYASMLKQGLDGATPEQVLQVPLGFYREMGLDQVLTQQRLNGAEAILAHMKQLSLSSEESAL